MTGAKELERSDDIILHLTGMRATKYGGLEHYFVRLFRECARRGWRSCIQYEEPPASLGYLRDLEGVGADIRVCRTEGIPLRGSIRIARLIRSLRPRIVHVHFLDRYTRLTTPLLARRLGVESVVCTVHHLQRLSRTSSARFAYARYDRVLAVSGAVADCLLTGGVPRSVVSTHYLGLIGERERSRKLRDRFRSEFGLPDCAVVLSTIAFDHPVKGLDLLVDAFAGVTAKHPEARLVVIGVDSARSTLPALAARLGLSSRVHWAGIRDEGWKLLNAADIYVQPSRAEGLPLAILEAMALKLPVVATRVGGNPEAVVPGETGDLVTPGDPVALARALDRMIANRSRWAALGEAGLARYRKLFSADRSIASLIEKHYRLDGRNPHRPAVARPQRRARSAAARPPHGLLHEA